MHHHEDMYERIIDQEFEDWFYSEFGFLYPDEFDDLYMDIGGEG